MHHDWHIKMQSAFQRYTENAVSKTINMSNSVTVEDIKAAYLLSWTEKCKGVTVFRDGCKDAQVLNLGTGSKKAEEKADVPQHFDAVEERPFEVRGSTYRLNTPVGNAFITINQDGQGEPVELFINVGKAGSDVTAMAQALGRTISTSLRFHGGIGRMVRAKEIAEQLAGIGGRRSVGFGPKKILSLPDAIAAALSIHLGLRVNGFGPKEEFAGEKLQTNGIVNSKQSLANSPSVNGNDGNGTLNAGTQQDLAGAVMPAQLSALQSPDVSQDDDHTMASAESYLASDLGNGNGHANPQQLILEESGLASKKVGDICPTCGASSFVYQEGCAKCYSCGFSEC